MAMRRGAVSLQAGRIGCLRWGEGGVSWVERSSEEGRRADVLVSRDGLIPLQLFAELGGRRLHFVHHAGRYLGFVLGFGLGPWAWAALDLGQPWQWNMDPGG